MNNTIENARQLYISSIKGDRNRIYTTHALLNFGDKAVASNLNCDELFNLMVDYHNAIIQSKIEELEKKLNTDDVIEQYRIEELINFFKGDAKWNKHLILMEKNIILKMFFI